METKTNDIYSKVTNQIIEAIEEGVKNFSLPWYPIDNQNPFPRNVVSRQQYRGINILLLWFIAEKKNYQSGVWGTFKQWQSLGATVKKGEKAAVIVYSNQIEKEPKEGEDKENKYYLMKGYPVFNIAQVENYNISSDLLNRIVKTNEEIDNFFNSLNPNIVYSGDLACYSQSKDTIFLPPVNNFKNTESYYSVLSHEMIHWTAHETRVNRNLANRFGSVAYAMEELIAELGAAFLSAELGVSNKPRKDHANYIATWLEVLRNDKKAIFHAAAKAQQAVEWMKDKQTEKLQAAA